MKKVIIKNNKIAGLNDSIITLNAVHNIVGMITVEFHKGFVCTCSNDEYTLNAENIDGFYAFSVPSLGEWVVRETNGVETNQQIVMLQDVGDVKRIKFVMQFTKYIRTNYSDLGFVLTNYLYNTYDHIVFRYKADNPPNAQGDWPALLGINRAHNSKLYLQGNYWQGRKVLNLSYNGQYTGDDSMSYESPFDYEHEYILDINKNIFTMYRGNFETVAFTKTFTLPATSSTATTPFKIFHALDDNQKRELGDWEFYQMQVYRMINGQEILIHDYVPVLDGIYDKVESFLIEVTTTGHINGPRLESL